MASHLIDKTALFFGALFCGLAALFLIDLAVGGIDQGWAWALGLVVLGAAGVFVSIPRLVEASRSDRDLDPPPA